MGTLEQWIEKAPHAGLTCEEAADLIDDLRETRVVHMRDSETLTKSFHRWIGRWFIQVGRRA